MVKEEITFGFINNIDTFNYPAKGFEKFIENKDSYQFGEDALWIKAVCNGRLAAILSITPNKYKERTVNINMINMEHDFARKFVDIEILQELKHILFRRNMHITADLNAPVNIPINIYEDAGFFEVSDDYMEVLSNYPNY